MRFAFVSFEKLNTHTITITLDKSDIDCLGTQEHKHTFLTALHNEGPYRELLQGLTLIQHKLDTNRSNALTLATQLINTGETEDTELGAYLREFVKMMQEKGAVNLNEDSLEKSAPYEPDEIDNDVDWPTIEKAVLNPYEPTNTELQEVILFLRKLRANHTQASEFLNDIINGDELVDSKYLSTSIIEAFTLLYNMLRRYDNK